jgi:diguanylate cyclase (GGDEF)-like protein
MTRVQTIREANATYDPDDLALMSRAIGSRATLPDRDQAALQLASVLQTSLECDKVIELFSRQIQGIVPHAGLAFENKALALSFVVGHPERCGVSYQLDIAGETLGQLTVTRKRKFEREEISLLEHLLCCLVYPLRNALLYRSAVAAALRDPLTGVSNRAALNAVLARETELSRRHGSPLSLIALDLDHFKEINDRHGHLAGDQVLKSVAAAITECIRSSDILFRYGGEEFLVLLSNTARQGALMLAERIRRSIEDHECHYGEHRIRVTTSLGVACYAKGETGEHLFRKADTALYEAKAAGRNCVKFSP